MSALRLGLIGVGKIARDQHLPAIAANPAFRLCGVATPSPPADVAVPAFTDHNALLREVELDAVAICTPSAPRHAIARDCLAAGLHCLLEKPPCATLGEAIDLSQAANAAGRTLFATWHAREHPAVAEAARITREEGIATLAIRWLEDVEKWHSGQQWIWEPGGLGVFDAGINALSILTLLLREPVIARSATFLVHEGGQQPLAASLDCSDASGAATIAGTFDWRHKGAEQWDIDMVTRCDTHLLLTDGGQRLTINGEPFPQTGAGEYPTLYARFADLIERTTSDADLEPLRLLADISLIARRLTSETKPAPF